MFDFRNLVKKHSVPITIEEETDGDYDYEDGGKWKPVIQTRETIAALFNLTTKDINSAIQYGEGGSYTKADKKVYVHESLVIGSKIIHDGKKYTISTELDYGEYAHGLRIYIAKGVKPKEYASAEE